MTFNEKVYEVIKNNNTFDGVFYEKFLNNPLKYNDKDIVRVIINGNNDIMVHLLDDEDDTEFVYFYSLDEEIQANIVKEITKCTEYDLDTFFDKVKLYMLEGDRLMASNDDCDDDNLVYTLYNECNDVIYEYHSKYNLCIGDY